MVIFDSYVSLPEGHPHRCFGQQAYLSITDAENRWPAGRPHQRVAPEIEMLPPDQTSIAEFVK